MAKMSLILLLLASLTSCRGSWVEENVYQDVQSPKNDVTSTDRRQLLLSVLVNLGKLYGDDQELPSDYRDGAERQAPGVQLDFDTSFLKDTPGEVRRRQPSKRARYEVSGVLPPFGELCRALRIAGCFHSRYK
ncbi:uncharacterized protein [Littorina saxatilis]|uniref:uncharacterized protein n=1 Tax=Littorina saxatilis TaxID=31220 RepID=UPI0038B597BE